MTRARTRLVLAVIAGLTTSTTMLAAPAAGKVVHREEFQEPISETLKNFCGVTGLNVELEGVVEGRFLVTSRGRDKLPYFMELMVMRATYTNEATGESVTEVVRTLNKDLKITDNGDGTLTILVLATGPATVYGSDGKAIARNPGQVRFEILIDHGGTPEDPSDDKFVAFLGFVKESTGRSDDFCSAVLPALT